MEADGACCVMVMTPHYDAFMMNMHDALLMMRMLTIVLLMMKTMAAMIRNVIVYHPGHDQ